MTEKDFKRLSREDLLELLVGQNREAEKLGQEILVLTEQLKRLKTDLDKTEALYRVLARYNVVLPDQNIDAVRRELSAFILKCDSGELRAEAARQVAEESPSSIFSGRNDDENAMTQSVIAEGLMDMASGIAGKISDASAGSRGGRTAGEAASEDGKTSVKKRLAGQPTGEQEISDEFEDDDNVNDTEDAIPDDVFDFEDASDDTEYERKPKKSEPKTSRVGEALAWARMQFGGKK